MMNKFAPILALVLATACGGTTEDAPELEASSGAVRAQNHEGEACTVTDVHTGETHDGTMTPLGLLCCYAEEEGQLKTCLNCAFPDYDCTSPIGGLEGGFRQPGQVIGF